MKAEVHGTYKARVKYHRTDDLRQDGKIPDDGAEIEVRAMYRHDSDESFPGQMIFLPVDERYSFWLPECDLEILEEIP